VGNLEKYKENTMTSIPFNSPGGFSTGLTATTIITQTGGITAANLFISGGATFNSVVGFNDGSTQNTAYKSSNYGPVITDSAGDVIINPKGMITATITNSADFGITGGGGYRLFLLPFFFDKGCTLTRIATIQGGAASGHTGSLKFAVYDTNQSSGLPLNKLYESSTINITTTNFQRYSATPNTFIQPGSYWIGYIMDLSKKTDTHTWSWSVLASVSYPWDSFSPTASRWFNNGGMGHLRYSFDTMTLGATLAHGFTAAFANSTPSPIAAVGWGTSEMVSGSRSPFVGVSVQQ
jgi:hypothetical protein